MTMGKTVSFEQLMFPPTYTIRLGSNFETAGEPENALSYAWHVVGVLAVEGQLDGHVDQSGHFVPFEFMETELSSLLANTAPLTNADVWQLAIELQRAFEAMSDDEVTQLPLLREAA